MKPRSAIESDLFAASSRAPKIDSPGDPLVKISRVVASAALASDVFRISPRVVSAKGGRPAGQLKIKRPDRTAGIRLNEKFFK